MRIVLLLTALAAVTQAQTDCSLGACYPPTGDLLLGRGHQLHASSTCGLTGSEIFCTPYQQRRMKCCPCDSTDPDGPLAHTMKEVLSTSDPDRWWQSRKELNPVNVQLDLKNLFQLENVILNFKGPRPSSFVIERTLDDGQTWQPALYLATDCARAFPGVPTSAPVSLDTTYCYTLPPTGANPYQDHTIQFSPKLLYSHVPAPNSRKIEEAAGLTGLRVRMTELGEVPRLPGRSLSRFYALKGMKVTGSCMCHGHANRCLPEAYNGQLASTIQVNPQCDCQHNTAGVNCERCLDLYNDRPWSPAEEGNTRACQRCECNNHASRCYFDRALYEASGRRSGGVCEDCQHHTTGPKCDQCAPGYQPNPYSRMDRPDACISCVCSTEGTLNGGRCDDSGSCQCKVNVEGERCDRCRRGYYGLSAANPLGCSKCSCSPDGSLSDICDPLTGQCLCRPHLHGQNCDVCSKGYWKPTQPGPCKPCGCDPTGSTSDACDQVTGQCQCRPNIGGRTCTECPDNTYGDPLTGCTRCRCDPEGTLPEMCDKQTGDCLCRPGVTGPRCDSCKPGHCDSFPTCDTCPSCFFTLSAQGKNLSLTLQRLHAIFPTRPGPGGDLGKFGPRIKDLEDALRQIQDSIGLPPSTGPEIDKALSQLDKLKDMVDETNKDLPPLERDPKLDSELDKLRDLLDRLTKEYKAKKNALDNTISPNSTGSLDAIKDAYDESKDAAKKVDDTKKTVKESADNREEAMTQQNQVQPENTRGLDRLNQSAAAGPDLTPVAKQVCGSVRTEPCTPLQCKGEDLCPPEGVAACKKGEKCVGALPLSKKADKDTKDVKDKLTSLSEKITDAAEKLQDTQDTTNQVRQTTEKLSNKMKKARDQLEDDLKETRDVVKELRDFLSDPASNLTQIQNVSEDILKTKLPLSLAALKRKLDELKNMAEKLPNSTAVLKDAQPQLDKAKKLLKEAEDARDKAQDNNDEVDDLLKDIADVDEDLSDLEERLQDTMDNLDDVNRNLTKARDELEPAERALDEAEALIQPVAPKLDEITDLLGKGRDKAEEAQDKADEAQDEADAANNEVDALRDLLDQLKDKIPEGGGGGGDAGPAGDRLAKLKEDVGNLANTTDTMLKSLDGKADNLRTLQDEIVDKSKNLEGLEEKLKDILEQLKKKAYDLNNCKG